MKGKPVTAIIVQARLGSTRLPGKIMQEIGGRTVLAHDIGRLKAVHGADHVVIATTDKDSDTPVAEAALAYGAQVFRGDEADVLSRYLGAARMVDADIVMRVTSDCPLIDPDLCAAVLKLRAEASADYAANNMPRLFPHGLDCEAFTRAALERAAAEATDPYDREHVTPWLRRVPGLHRVNLVGPGWPANQQRWTLDFPEDLDFFKALFAELPQNPIPSWQEALSFIGQRPSLSDANARHRAKSTMAGDREAPIAVFHFAANAIIGSGHAMRCNTLQSRLEAMGWRCHWALDAVSTDFLRNTISPDALIALSAADSLGRAQEIAAAIGHCDVLVIDHYDVAQEFATAMRAHARQIVYLDDLANRAMDADLIVNPTPGFSADDYSKLNARPARCLLGPDAALLRQQFAARRARMPAPDHPLQRILVAFGGVDPLNGTGLALEILARRPQYQIDVVLGGGAPHLAAVKAQVAAQPEQFRLLTDVADMAGTMVVADLVIGAPGISTWERGCLGLPSLLVGIAENQRANAAIVESAGAGIVAGFLTDEDRASVGQRLADALDGLAAAPTRRREMALAAAGLCDGRGTQRVVVALLPPLPIKSGQSLRLRPMEAADEALLLDWQRAPETRRYALTPHIPTAEEHHAWFGRKLAADQDWLLLGEVDGTPVGYVRLDWMGEDKGRPQYLMSIAAAPGFYGQGIGSALLSGARQLAPGAHFYAKVLAENTASVALFERANYQLAADGYFHAHPAQRKEA
jgi:UDP-2,4-diacetamido-2,4,6-trideoxy-beta-L-altropyranose hydrolase